jgi:hypothetical protein
MICKPYGILQAAIPIWMRFILKTAVEFRTERPTVSNQKGMQGLKESPFWSDAEQCKVLPGVFLGAFPKGPRIKGDEVCVCKTKAASQLPLRGNRELASWPQLIPAVNLQRCTELLLSAEFRLNFASGFCRRGVASSAQKSFIVWRE